MSEENDNRPGGSDPDSEKYLKIQALLRDAQVALDREDLNSASTTLKKIFSEQPAERQAYLASVKYLYLLFKQGVAAQNRDSASDALAKLQELSQSAHADENAFLLMGRCYIVLQDRDRAAECFRSALKMDPENDAARDALENLHRMSGQRAIEVEASAGTKKKEAEGKKNLVKISAALLMFALSGGVMFYQFGLPAISAARAGLISSKPFQEVGPAVDVRSFKFPDGQAVGVVRLEDAFFTQAGFDDEATLEEFCHELEVRFDGPHEIYVASENKARTPKRCPYEPPEFQPVQP